MWLDFIWLEIWAWVKVFATRRTDTKKKKQLCGWLTQDLRNFMGWSICHMKHSWKNIVMWLDCICHYMWSWVKKFATRGTYKKNTILWLCYRCLFICLMDIAPTPQRQHCYGFFLILICIHHGLYGDYFSYAASGGSTYIFKSRITYNALLGFVYMPRWSFISF